MDDDDSNEKRESQKGEEEDEEDEEAEMERKLAELKAEEVAELKRFVTQLFLHISPFRLRTLLCSTRWDCCKVLTVVMTLLCFFIFIILKWRVKLKWCAVPALICWAASKPVTLSCTIRKKRKLLKDRRKQRERVELKMDLPGVSIADSGDSSMFSLSTINKQKVKLKDTHTSSFPSPGSFTSTRS